MGFSIIGGLVLIEITIEDKFRELLKCFCEDLTATQNAKISLDLVQFLWYN
jgi:hypothetical protein